MAPATNHGTTLCGRSRRALRAAGARRPLTRKLGIAAWTRLAARRARADGVSRPRPTRSTATSPTRSSGLELAGGARGDASPPTSARAPGFPASRWRPRCPISRCALVEAQQSKCAYIACARRGDGTGERARRVRARRVVAGGARGARPRRRSRARRRSRSCSSTRRRCWQLGGHARRLAWAPGRRGGGAGCARGRPSWACGRVEVRAVVPVRRRARSPPARVREGRRDPGALPAPRRASRRGARSAAEAR